MSESLFIFTFSPVQGFINDSRKLRDLAVSSGILVELAREAAKPLVDESKGRRLVYPPDIGGDIPNKIVAIVRTADCESVAKEVQDGFYLHWAKISEKARRLFFSQMGDPAVDETWYNIWKRQTQPNYFWETYWGSFSIDENSYGDSYAYVEKVLAGVKRLRQFSGFIEPGEKDTLSGMREALHCKNQTAKDFWDQTASKARGHAVKKSGREVLDSIGLIKRFYSLEKGKTTIDSICDVATRMFTEREENKKGLLAYQHKLIELGILKELSNWDTSLLYKENLEKDQLVEDLGVTQITDEQVKKAQQALKDLLEKKAISSYYGIIKLDGDNMGLALSGIKSEIMHREFSQKIDRFSRQAEAKSLFGKHLATPVFMGGDDVLVLAPLASVVNLALELAKLFKEETKISASAGVVIAHYRSPLSAVLRDVQHAEHTAKQVDGKDALCILVEKHSGQNLQVVGKWATLEEYFFNWVGLIGDKENGFSSRLPYSILENAEIMTLLPNEARLAELRRLTKQHWLNNDKAMDPSFSKALSDWANALDAIIKNDDILNKEEMKKQGFVQLGYWLAFARFVKMGGFE